MNSDWGLTTYKQHNFLMFENWDHVCMILFCFVCVIIITTISIIIISTSTSAGTSTSTRPPSLCVWCNAVSVRLRKRIASTLDATQSIACVPVPVLVRAPVPLALALALPWRMIMDDGGRWWWKMIMCDGWGWMMKVKGIKKIKKLSGSLWGTTGGQRRTLQKFDSSMKLPKIWLSKIVPNRFRMTPST